MSPVRWGMLGAGWISRQAIAPAMHDTKNAQLYAVAARSAQRAAALRPAGPVYTEYQSILDDPDVDAVYIALDNGGHEEWITRALGAGKPVLCEKPLTMHSGTTERVMNHAEALGVPLVEAVWNLWHPRTQRLLELLRQGAIEDITSIRGTFAFNGVPEDNYRLDPDRGGGSMLDVGCYPLTAAAAALSATTSLPETLVDMALSVANIEREKSANGVDLRTVALLDIAGVSMSVESSFIDIPHQFFVVTGTGGAISLDQESFTSYKQQSTLTWIPNQANGVPIIESFAPVDAYSLMIRNVGSSFRAWRDGTDESQDTGHPSAWLPDPAWSRWTAGVMSALRSRETA
ncbi:MAG: Gfo/Idh/MocA family oxidoreductase [Candidatus Nanopelagicales bacterium]